MFEQLLKGFLVVDKLAYALGEFVGRHCVFVELIAEIRFDG